MGPPEPGGRGTLPPADDPARWASWMPGVRHARPLDDGTTGSAWLVERVLDGRAHRFRVRLEPAGPAPAPLLARWEQPDVTIEQSIARDAHGAPAGLSGVVRPRGAAWLVRASIARAWARADAGER